MPRLVALEQRHYRAAVPSLRIFHTIISPGRDVVGLYLPGQHFDRAEGESVEELKQRAMRAVGWEGE
jgi:hypothetical protein